MASRKQQATAAKIRLDQATARSETARKAHRANLADPDAAARYRAAKSELAAARRAYRQVRITVEDDGDGVAHPVTIGVGARMKGTGTQ